MAMLISFPFRLTPSGAVAVRDEVDEEYLGEELAQLLQTEPGERELVPTYGISDPAYAGVSGAALAAQVAVFGPPVVVDSVETSYVSDTQQDVVVRFTPAPDLAGEGEPSNAAAEAMFSDDFEEF